MSVELRPVEQGHLRAIWELEVSDDQRGLVAPNLVTLAQGPYEGGAYPMGIWDGDTPVGFLSVIDMRENHHLDEGDEPEAAYLWRFMIAAGHQRKGYGRAALEQLKDWVRALQLRRIYTSAVPENEIALSLYEASGFVRTGRISDGEVELRCDLHQG
jgi:diamine N-acetyltransferase